MGAITQLSEKCRKCQFVDKCDHKEMEHLAYYEPAASSIENFLFDSLSLDAGKEEKEKYLLEQIKSAVNVAGKMMNKNVKGE